RRKPLVTCRLCPIRFFFANGVGRVGRLGITSIVGRCFHPSLERRSTPMQHTSKSHSRSRGHPRWLYRPRLESLEGRLPTGSVLSAASLSAVGLLPSLPLWEADGCATDVRFAEALSVTHRPLRHHASLAAGNDTAETALALLLPVVHDQA